MKELDESIKEILLQVHDREHKYFTTSYDGVVGVQDEDVRQIKKLMLDTLKECLGEEYVFERPKDDYLPNVYQFLKGKNELRQSALTKLQEKLDLTN